MVEEKQRIEAKKTPIIESEVVCPYCNSKQSSETKYAHVTYWGEVNKDSDHEETCEICNEKFYVIEHVTRTFVCTKGMEGV